MKDFIDLERAADEQLDKCIAEKRAVQEKITELTDQYVKENFPYKVGDRLRYAFVNSDSDFVVREIQITDLYYQAVPERVIIYYDWNGMTRSIDDVDMDGKLHAIFDTESLEKI